MENKASSVGRFHSDGHRQPKPLEAPCQWAQLQADSSLPIGSEPDSRAAVLQRPLLPEEGSLFKTRIARRPDALEHGESSAESNQHETH